MATEVKLPELGDGIEAGDVLDVFVKEGDTIAKDQAVCELETDKAMVEVPSSAAGTVVKVHISQGDSVPIGAVLITVDADGASDDSSASEPAAKEEAKPGPEQEPDPEPLKEPEPKPEVAERESASAPAPEPPAPSIAPARTAPAPTPAATPATVADSSASAPASPAIRRLAREVGIDLAEVTGTGESGRITREDVLHAVRHASAPAAPTSDRPAPAASATSEVPAASATEDAWGPIRTERMTKIRKTIASKMHESWSAAPRVTNFDDADVTELERIRQASKQDYKSRGIKLTSMPFVIKAVAMALKNNPEVNAAIDEVNEQIIYKQYVNIGIAVDTDRGLVVPSLRHPDEQGIADIARSLGVIAENARGNNFKIEDLRGSTFTISNLGAIGGTYSTPIINVPEVAILLLGRSRKLPVVVEDDKIEARLMMPMSLSYDHRLVDGATAARFLNDIIAFLENPSRLLIAP